jgi:hypothetical protein
VAGSGSDNVFRIVPPAPGAARWGEPKPEAAKKPESEPKPEAEKKPEGGPKPEAEKKPEGEPKPAEAPASG